jgi:CRP-like cAMP-binding protein
MSNPLILKLEQFTSFSSKERHRLDELLSYRTKTFERGDTILRDGDEADAIHLVTAGLAARSKALADGSRQFMAFLFPGDLCDVEVFVLSEMDHDILALADTTCVMIPIPDMEKLLTEHSNITRALWWSTMTDSAVLREWIVNHGSRDARARVSHLFYEMLIRSVGQAEHNTICFPMTLEEFSDATGITSVHLSRVLRELRSEGVIELNQQTLTIADPERLADIAGFEARYLHLDRTENRDREVSHRAKDLVERT